MKNTKVVAAAAALALGGLATLDSAMSDVTTERMIYEPTGGVNSMASDHQATFNGKVSGTSAGSLKTHNEICDAAKTGDTWSASTGKCGS